jgi:hypothetical protein
VDGIHMRFLKAVTDTPIITQLHQLFQLCIKQGRTPQAWNRSEIHLLSKDTTRPRDANNLRPISLICMFRKLFERLVLVRWDQEPWAQLHPGQAGFRREYSTYINAATVHALLGSGRRSTAVFLDFKAAFDMVDHQILLETLQQRGCPQSVARLLYGLMCDQVESRLFLNGCVSPWFVRTQGVLQGSPLSPWLFNLFIDELLWKLNQETTDVPICLFYADDGAIITPAKTDVQELLKTVEEWATQHRLELRIEKCGYLSTRRTPPRLYLYQQELCQRQTYEYLGFPMTPHGIDFPRYLERRIQAAIKRSSWLGLHSNAWGVAHRLRIYKQYLAPMFEYGAPLVWAWAQESPANMNQFETSTHAFQDLMAWVGNYAGGRHGITANLCGLLSIRDRFQQLATAYQLILERLAKSNPLKQLLTLTTPNPGPQQFLQCLDQDPLFARFRRAGDFEPSIKKALARFLRRYHHEKVVEDAARASLTRLIPLRSRRVQGLYMADVSLSGPIAKQEWLFQYRRGVFMLNYTCVCHPQVKFRRGHEDCTAIDRPLSLTFGEKRLKWLMRVELDIEEAKFTDVDFLLNIGRTESVVEILLSIRNQLRQVYAKSKRERNITDE